MKKYIIAIICLKCIFNPAVASEALRIWTNTDGSKIEASLMSYNPHNKNVTIKRQDGRVFTFSHELLSAEDNDYLNIYLQNEKKANEEITKLRKLSKAEIESVYFTACENSDFEKLKLLLKLDFNLVKATKKVDNGYDSKDKLEKWENKYFTYTGLLWIIEKSNKTDQRLECMKLLIKYGADAKASTARKGSGSAGNAIRIYSLLSLEELELLLSNGADPNFGFCVNRSTLLLQTVESIAKGEHRPEDYELVKLLVKYNANPNQKTVAINKGDATISPADIAKKSGNDKLVKALRL